MLRKQWAADGWGIGWRRSGTHLCTLASHSPLRSLLGRAAGPFSPQGVFSGIMEDAGLDDLLSLAAFDSAPKAKAKAQAARPHMEDLMPLDDVPIVGEQEHLVPVPLELASASGEQVVHRPARPAPKFKQRDPALMAHARAALERKRQAEKLAVEVSKRQRAEAQLQVIAMSAPGLSKSLGLVVSQSAALSRVVRAQLLVKLAAMPRIRSAVFETLRKKQAAAVRVVAGVLDSITHAYFRSLLQFRSASSSAVARVGKVIAFVCEWDETSQRFAALRKASASRHEKDTTAKVSSQVMVASGSIVTSGFGHGGLCVEPWLTNTMALEETSTNFILEGLLRSLPFNMEDKEQMRTLSNSVGEFVFSATVDRASSNLVCAEWIAQVLSKLPENLLPWCEFCAAHGCALVKGRAPLLKKVSASLVSLTSWLRYSRNVAVLRQEMVFSIGQSLEIRQGGMSR